MVCKSIGYIVACDSSTKSIFLSGILCLFELRVNIDSLLDSNVHNTFSIKLVQRIEYRPLATVKGLYIFFLARIGESFSFLIIIFLHLFCLLSPNLKIAQTQIQNVGSQTLNVKQTETQHKSQKQHKHQTKF